MRGMTNTPLWINGKTEKDKNTVNNACVDRRFVTRKVTALTLMGGYSYSFIWIGYTNEHPHTFPPLEK
jgi:hypothetical protein